MNNIMEDLEDSLKDKIYVNCICCNKEIIKYSAIWSLKNHNINGPYCSSECKGNK